MRTLTLPACLIMVTSLLMSACTTMPEPEQSSEGNGPTWPRPPEAARIVFLESFRMPRDLGIRPSAFRRLISAIAGDRDIAMVRPYAMSALQQRLLVGDPGLRALHIIDRTRKSYEVVTSLGQYELVSPVGVTQTRDRLFVSDSALGKVFVLDSKGELLKTISGFERPTGLAFDTTSGRLYVADTLSHKIRVFDRDGLAQFEFGERGNGEGEFNFPSHIFFSSGNLLVNDNMNFRIQTFDPDGRFVSSFGNHGDGSGSFSQPKGVAADSDNNVYVAGATIDRVQVFSREGKFLLAFGSSGTGSGQFQLPTGITIANDIIYVADSLNRRVQVFQYVHSE
jgi:sugar lactone lactonase YvrE